MGKTYYYETDGVGVTADAPVPDVGTGTHNFGQQPFAGSNVTYDQKAGTVMLDVTPSSDPTINDSQIWSDGVTTSGAPEEVGQPITNIFDGNLSTMICGGGDKQATFSVNFNGKLDGIIVNTLELAWRTSDYGATEGEGLRFTVNNATSTETTVSFGPNLNPAQWVAVSNPPSTLETIEAYSNYTVNNSNGLLLAGIKINGKILVDALYPGPYDTLYQTWEQWARTALGYALDRINKLEADTDALRTRIESALTRISSIESDEVDDDAVSSTLLTLVNDLLARVEALEGGS